MKKIYLIILLLFSVSINSQSLIGTGQLPKFEEDLFKVTDDLFLINSIFNSSLDEYLR